MFATHSSAVSILQDFGDHARQRCTDLTGSAHLSRFVGHEILAGEADKATENVQKGGAMSEPFGNSEYFPLDMVNMMAVAEESNNLEAVLVQIADTNEARTGRMIDLGVRLVEPILLTMVAGAVALIAIALLVPILTMSSIAKH